MFYAFGEYTLDTQLYELRRAGERIHLGPQVFNVLAYLVQHCHRVVPKQELFERLWPGQFVGDDALERCIRVVRRALGDTRPASQLIQTIRGRGYRFMAVVEVRPPEAPGTVGPGAPPTPVLPVPQAGDGPERGFPPVPMPSGADTSHPPPRTPEGEHKPVTVLCCELAEAKALVIRMGPEAMHRLMQAVFALAQEVVQRYEGTIVQFGGDGFRALFGAAVAQEDHARRAVLAAVEFQQQLDDRLSTVGLPSGQVPAVGIGVHTGVVVVGRLGADPQRVYTASGDTTALASRLQHLAAPGAILMSETTWQLVQDEVQVEPHGTIAVEGKPTPVPVHTFRRMARRRSGVPGRGMRAWSPFVGRMREIALLQERLAQVEGGRGHVVGIAGEPGIGKSRLLDEFRHTLAGKPVTYSEGHCLSYGRTTPYLPVLDLLRQLCGITDADSPPVVTARVRQQLLVVGLDPVETAPTLLHLLGITVETEGVTALSPEERGARTFAILRQFSLQCSQHQPLILAVENLHWIDATSEDYLTSLVERLAGAPILLLATYRPGYRPPWLEKSYATQLALPGLTARDSQVVVQSVLQTTPLGDARRREIVEKAGGNPFFLEELTRAIAAHDEHHPTLVVPDTIQAVLAARMDRLPPEEKRLLQTAAVLGMEVSVPLLQAVVEWPEEALARGLMHLQAGEFLYETRRVPKPAYTFTHALTQQVAYETLLLERRRVLHGRVAQAIEELFAERLSEHYYALAHHYSRSGNTTKAVDYLQRAGQQAVERSAYAEGVSHLTTALDLLTTLPETRERSQQELGVQMTLGIALRATKGQAAPEVARLYTRARALCERVGEPSQLFRVLWGFCHVHGLRGDYQTRRALGEQLLSLAQRLEDSDFLLEAHHTLWTTLLAGGELTAARPHLEQGMKLYDPQRHRTHAALYSGHDPGVCCRMQAAHSLWLLGYPDQALGSIQAALVLAQQLAHPLSLSMALRWAAVLHYLRREAPLTQARAEAAIIIATDHGFLEQVALVTPLRDWALAATGTGEEGIAPNLQSLADSQATEATRDRSDYLALLAETFAQVGQIDKGLEALAEGLATVAKNRIRWWEAELYRLRGELLLRQTVVQPEEAEVCFQQALAVARREQAKSWELRTATSLARLWQRQGKGAAAHELLTPVYGWFTEGFDTADLREAKALLQELRG
jgi:class 3 adenylate cyclase/predicted ATPase/DNA-binding winged helix-turn-helix (wHTH) protein